MDVSEAKRLKGLEDENARLKRLLADAMLDNAALKDLLGRNAWSAPLLQGFRAWPLGLRKCIGPLISQPLLAARP